MLLRIAIGWHFHTEGWEKVKSVWKGEKPFTAEPYLRASTGPLAPYFRGLVPDVNGLAKLDPARLKAGWRDDVNRIADHYGFSDAQRDKAVAELHDSEQYADLWFADREMSEKRRKYIHELAEVQKVERDFGAMPFERERAAEKRRDLDKERRDLLKDLDARGAALREAVAKLATPEQVASAKPYAARTSLDYVNLSTTFGLWLIGLCLMLGLLTRLSALAAALFLLQIYLSMPPWPGLPPNPKAEGHYYVVDKNLVEMLACLALVFLPTGHWVGLDAVVFRRFRRGAAAEEVGGEPEHVGGRGRRAHRVS